MRLWVMSDLHTEHAPLELPREFPAADVCVVAGDFGAKGVVKSLEWLHRHVVPAMPVVFVAGNHDYYGTSLMESVEEGRAAAASMPGVHFLENETVDLFGVTFAGCTLWTDYDLHGGPELAMWSACRSMNDYRKIRFSKRPFERFTPTRALRMHRDSRRFLSEALADDGRRTVVVTHHAPSQRSLPPCFHGDQISPAYASDMEDLMMQRGPALWVHGHIHEPVDYVVGKTRVVSSPRGYPGERTDTFQGTVLEI